MVTHMCCHCAARCTVRYSRRGNTAALHAGTRRGSRALPGSSGGGGLCGGGFRDKRNVQRDVNRVVVADCGDLFICQPAAIISLRGI